MTTKAAQGSATPASALAALFTPEVLSAVVQLSRFAEQLVTTLTQVREHMMPVAEQMAAVLSEPRAAEYEAFLIDIGYEPMEARFLSIWTIAAGRAFAEELNAHRRGLGSALREVIGTADGSTLVIARRAAALHPLLNDWTKPWIENGIKESGAPLSFEAFTDLVGAAARREPAACAQLGAVSRQISPHVPKARGASLTSATVTHALLLMISHEAGHRAGYTYSALEGVRYVDQMTAATRRQLRDADFSPVAGRRLAKTLGWTEDEGRSRPQ